MYVLCVVFPDLSLLLFFALRCVLNKVFYILSLRIVIVIYILTIYLGLMLNI